MLLRAGLWLLTALTAATGVLATFLPRVFYDDIPWVALNPPYSEHLMRDFGAMNLGLALTIGVAAATMHPLLVRTALGAYLLFAIPHLHFHATHLEGFTTTEAATELVVLAVTVALPVVLLSLTRRRSLPGPGSPPPRHR
jgi:hypothetical protein